jgi:hypothetical protein
MSFREKSALVTLVVLVIAAVGYAGRAQRHPPANAIMAMPGLVGAMMAVIGIMILSHIILIIAVGPKEARHPSDERDRLVLLASRRNGGWIGIVGLWMILMLAVTAASHLTIAYTALGLFVLAELVMHGSQLIYYRRGV